MKSNYHLFQSMINDWLAVKRGPGDPGGGFNPGEDVNAVRQVIRKSQNRSLQNHYEEVFLPPSDDFFLIWIKFRAVESKKNRHRKIFNRRRGKK